VSYQLIFHEKAKQEYIDSFIWYGSRLNGLEDRFKIAVESVLQQLTQNPQHFGYSEEPFREASIEKFLFTIIFTINYTQSIVFIAAIYHSKRNLTFKFRKQ